MVWEVKKLEKSIEKVKYTLKIPKNKFLSSGEFPIISQEKEFINGYWNNPDDIFKVDTPVVIFGDHTQVLKYVDFDFVLGADGVKILQPIKEINAKFFYYFLMDINLKSLGYARHYRLLKEKEVPIPPLPIQKKIVKILDEAFEKLSKTKENAERNLDNSKEVFESYLRSVFENKGEGWEEKKLGAIGKVSMCKRIFKDQTTPTGDIPFYKIGTFGKEPNAFISNEIYDEFRKKFSFPKKGDILLSASGTIGRCVKYDGRPAYFQDSNIVWIDNDEKQLLNDYLFYFYGSCDWNSTKGATISRLYNDNLKKIKIAFPKSLEEQKQIVTKFDNLSVETKKLSKIYNQKLTDLDELKKSILQKAFNGELTKGN